jgi:tetratricopeptide (TPR) repeat protein
MNTDELLAGALGNCEVCNGEKKERGYMLTPPGVRPFWVCEDCYVAYHSLDKEMERASSSMPTGRNLQKAILLRREYLAAVAICYEGIELYNNRRYEEAAHRFLKTMGVFRDQGETRDYMCALGNLAMTYTDLGRFEDALNNHKEEEAICRRLGLGADLGISLCNQGLLSEKMGKLSDARRLGENAVEILSTTGGCPDALDKAKSLVERTSHSSKSAQGGYEHKRPWWKF